MWRIENRGEYFKSLIVVGGRASFDYGVTGLDRFQPLIKLRRMRSLTLIPR